MFNGNVDPSKVGQGRLDNDFKRNIEDIKPYVLKLKAKGTFFFLVAPIFYIH